MRLRPLTEAECYARCYGGRDVDVSLVPVASDRSGDREATDERLRQLFEGRLDPDEPDRALEAA